MVADKGKKQKIGENGGDEETAEILLSIDKLQEFQDELEKINEEASDKVLEIEQKYNALRKPVYEKRNEVMNTIPDFWLTAFLSHPALGDLLTDEDQKIFRYLSSLEVEDSTDVKSGYSISFIFKPNPFFENTKLTKTYTFLEEGTTKITATDIKWKEGMEIPNGVANEKKGSKRPPPDDSFFTWFTETQQKDTVDEFQDEVAEIIKDDLWPNPLTYFSNEGDEDDSDNEEGDEEQGDGSDEEEEEEDEEEEDE